MNELTFSDKVNGAYDKGWNSNPEFAIAVKEIEEVVKAERKKPISVQELFVGASEVDKNFFKRNEGQTR